MRMQRMYAHLLNKAKVLTHLITLSRFITHKCILISFGDDMVTRRKSQRVSLGMHVPSKKKKTIYMLKNAFSFGAMLDFTFILSVRKISDFNVFFEKESSTWKEQWIDCMCTCGVHIQTKCVCSSPPSLSPVKCTWQTHCRWKWNVDNNDNGGGNSAFVEVMVIHTHSVGFLWRFCWQIFHWATKTPYN